MTDRTQNTLTNISKVIGIATVCVGIITYMFGIGQQTEVNTIAIERNAMAISDAKIADSKIQIQLKEIETHLIYIRKALDD